MGGRAPQAGFDTSIGIGIAQPTQEAAERGYLERILASDLAFESLIRLVFMTGIRKRAYVVSECSWIELTSDGYSEPTTPGSATYLTLSDLHVEAPEPP